MVAAITSSAGCATTTEYRPVELPLPDRPTLPTLQAGDLQCLSDAAYQGLVERDARLQAHVERLEAIILTTRASE
jgi:hypothetical protein